MQRNQIHIDLETLDVAHTAKMLAIGAVCGEEAFYEEIDLASYPENNFTVSQETVEWWESMGGFQPSREPVSASAAVYKLYLWVQELKDKRHDEVNWEIWANSPSFDCAILNYHFKYYSIASPWKFWQERDVRTIKALSANMKLGIVQNKNQHNALDDAKNQQKMVDRVYMTLARNCALARDCLQGIMPGLENDGHK